jgi:DNA helicase II / ATP-dependent DNA helicase PcrA
MKEFILQDQQGSTRPKIDYAKELNAQQLAVVTEGDGPCLVLAGAGSGKTRTITYRVAYLLEQGVAPEEILLLTFTNKASREMIERVEGLLGTYPKGLWAGTFHSIANRMLRRYAKLIGFQPNFSILDQEDARDLVSLCVKELKISTKNKRFPRAAVLNSLISFKRNRGGVMETAVEAKHPKFLPLLDEIEQVEDRYRKQKMEQNAMDFDDLLLHWLKLLKEHPHVREELSSQFRYVLVDEFQDTNVIQAEIVKLLSGHHQNLLVVGDDAQSIYSFRAAEIKNILNFPDRYDAAKTFQMTVNYRSTPEILAVANSVIAYNSGQFEKELSADRPKGDLPLVVPANTAGKEAQYIAEQIQDLYSNGMNYTEISVLFRASFHAQALEFELMRRDIPYDYRGGLKFFERSHVKDIIAHLRVLHNVKDGMAWVRTLKIHPGIGLITAAKIARTAGAHEDLASAVAHVKIGGKKASAGWEGSLRIMSALLAARPLPAEQIRALAGSDDYQLYLENEFPNFRDRLDDIEQFSVFAEQFDDLGAFLEAVSLTQEHSVQLGRDRLFQEDQIVLSTIHQAKGLEWDAVFVMNVTEGSFPHARALDEDGGLEEERRLFYVAVTRARKKLFLTYPLTAGYDHIEIKQPSMFLDEIPEQQKEFVKLRSAGYRSNVGPRWKSQARDTSSGGWEEPTIVLNDIGEREERPMPSSFLSDINDLGNNE